MKRAFTAKRISRTATITLQGPIATVFPLFGPIEEKKWEDGWDPLILYPETGELEEGMVFATRGHADEEPTYTWLVSKYDPANRAIQYTVSTQNRCWTISIHCRASSGTQTQATVRYTYTGLTPLGNDLNERAMEKMYEKDLKDWEEAINHYLQTGTLLKRH